MTRKKIHSNNMIKVSATFVILLWFSANALSQVVPMDNPKAALNRLKAQRPDLKVLKDGAKISRLYGKAFGSGTSPIESAEQFRRAHARVFGVDRRDLKLGGPAYGGRQTQQLMYDRSTGKYKFTLVYYSQTESDIPVFRSHLRLLIRNDANNSLVLASSSLRDMGSFGVSRNLSNVNPIPIMQAFRDPDFPNPEQFGSPRTVIWPGNDGTLPANPRVAVEFTATTNNSTDVESWLYVVDAETGELLYKEDQIFKATVTGNVSGNASELPGSDTCETEVSTNLPYARVNIGSTIAYADENGDYTLSGSFPIRVTVESRIWGEWFRTFNIAGPDELLTESVFLPGPADFLHNSANNDEFVRSQVNAYVQANLVRDFILDVNPSYPGLDVSEMALNVNRNHTLCPAWYVAADPPSLNFCKSVLNGTGDTTYANFAFGTIVHHEYGHHLVNRAGINVQGQYGEGMGDCIAILTTDDPVGAFGFDSFCSGGLRDADASDSTYPCIGGIHACGMVLSGSVWDLRDELLATNPSTYRDILSDLTVNSILLWGDDNITPAITIDFLTLDDDDGDITNGTPHSTEVCTAFALHNLDCPDFTQNLIYVDAVSGSDLTGDGSELNPYQSIQMGIDEGRFYGDTVFVKPGIYNEQVDFLGKRISVISTEGPLATKIRSTEPSGHTVNMSNGENHLSVLEGFTLDEGHPLNSVGVCVGVCSEVGRNTPTIRGNIMDGHFAGVYIEELNFENPIAIPASIVNNTIVNCNNGILLVSTGLSTTIKNNVITSNTIGIKLQEATDPAPVLSYNDVYGNTTDYINLTAGTGSISVDPEFKSLYRLKSTSPCIDAGDPDPSFNDPDGTRNDMGALPYDYDTLRVPVEVATIQDAIDTSYAGDIILVSPGTYTENIDFNGKSLVVTSSSGPEVTTIAANNTALAVVSLDESEPKGTEISGFTITGSDFTGIFCDSSSPNILNNIIENNTSDFSNNGAGLDLNNTTGSLVRGNIFRYDTAQTYGSAIHTENCTDDTIAYNLIYSNYGNMEIRCLSTKAMIYNNTIDGDGSLAHGISNQSGNDTIDCRNNIVINATLDGIYAANGGFANTSNNLIWNSSRDSLGGVGILSDVNNVFDNPILTSDYRPYRLSPAIDAGDPAAHFDDADGTRNDIGSYPVYQVGGLSDFSTIQSAIDAVGDSEVVLVTPGTYTENINFGGKKIIVTSSHGSDTTSITAPSSPQAPVVTFSGEPKGAELSHFVVSGSAATGIEVSNSSPRILNNVIEHNQSNSSNKGAGIDLKNTTGSLVKGNIFRFDTAHTYGAAMHIEDGLDDTICFNLSYSNRGSIEFRFLSSRAAIFNNTIDGAGSLAHGISAQNGNDTLDCRNNIVVNSWLDGIYAANSGYATINYNDIYGSNRDSLGGTGLIVGVGNIYGDPLLDANYLLGSSSPAIDAGDPDSFFNDPDSSRNDMGWQPFGTIFVLPKQLATGEIAFDDPLLPDGFSLSQNYPNPFNPTTRIDFQLPEPGYVTIEIYNILGQSVAMLVNTELPKGRHSIEWDGKNHSGKPVASGIYFYRLDINEFNESKKMMILK